MTLSQLIVLSLEPWDDVWRRNQLLVAALTADHPELRVLFVEPATPGLRGYQQRAIPRSVLRPAPGSKQVELLRPVEWIPDRLSPWLPLLAGRSVRRAARRLAFDQPVLWVNSHAFARFAVHTGWPVVYDITDDWLLADLPEAKRRRAELDDQLLMRDAKAVVVCSPALAASRGARPGVELIPNGVDVSHFMTAQPRPPDLGDRPTAVYVGTLHDERLDVKLGCALADELPDVNFVYVGPDSLSAKAREALTRRPNVRLLGARPYAAVPAYLQHADAVFIPHLVSPFTESLDPIKARECLAVGTPAVATPVAGFRDLGPPIRIAPADGFAAALRAALQDQRREPARDIWTWTAAAAQFRAVLEGVSG